MVPASRIRRLHRRTRSWVTQETTGGALLLGAAIAALIVANSPWRADYHAIAGLRIGIEPIELSLAGWAADALLAVFFFIVGAELIREFRLGSLRDPRQAAVPILAAVGGMIVPAVIYLGIVSLHEPAAVGGWAIPAATDIAFALAVLAVFGRGLPVAIRTFLLTLAVVDDLLAIVIIAFFYTAQIALWPLLGALATVVCFGLVARRRRNLWWVLLALAAVAWVLMHLSGVHATIAGVLLGLALPTRSLGGESVSRAVRFADAWRPFSSGVALPVFAFFAAGVSFAEVGGWGVLAEPVTMAIAVALIAGKFIGVLGTTALVTRSSGFALPAGISLRHLVPVGLLAGIGFTVSLLIAELSFPDEQHAIAATTGVLLGTLVSAVLAVVALSLAPRHAVPLTDGRSGRGATVPAEDGS